MPSDGLAGTVAYTKVQVRAMHAHRAHKAYDLEVAGTFAALGLVGKTQVGLGQATYTSHDPTGFNVFLPGVGFDFLLQILSGLQPERMNFKRFLLHSVLLFAVEEKD